MAIRLQFWVSNTSQKEMPSCAKLIQTSNAVLKSNETRSSSLSRQMEQQCMNRSEHPRKLNYHANGHNFFATENNHEDCYHRDIEFIEMYDHSDVDSEEFMLTEDKCLEESELKQRSALLALLASPMTSSSYETMVELYDQDTMRLLNRIAGSRTDRNDSRTNTLTLTTTGKIVRQATGGKIELDDELADVEPDTNEYIAIFDLDLDEY